MTDVRRDLRLAALFLLCSTMAGLIMSAIEPTGFGFWLHGLVLWLAGYVFVSHTTFPRRAYWGLLTAIPIAWLLANSGSMAGPLKILTALTAVLAITVAIVRRARPRSP